MVSVSACQASFLSRSSSGLRLGRIGIGERVLRAEPEGVVPIGADVGADEDELQPFARGTDDVQTVTSADAEQLRHPRVQEDPVLARGLAADLEVFLDALPGEDRRRRPGR